uniref:KIB1-4 beta-propeller domain-containing protein n=1 Tax=Leersia perrieri TaxID=77586 RepID=A0A0D9WGY5_9ORYZ
MTRFCCRICLRTLPRQSNCVLSDKPMNPGCVVLLVESIATVIWYCRVGLDSGWTRYEYDIGRQKLFVPTSDGEDEEKTPICTIAAYQGKFYFITRLDEIHVLEFSPAPVFSSLEIAYNEEFEYVYRAKLFLVESGEELYMAVLAYRGLFGRDTLDYEARVYKMDFS